MTPDEFRAKGFTPEQEKAFRALRVRHTVKPWLDRPSKDTIADLLPVRVAVQPRALCLCLVCSCHNARTVEDGRVCRECAKGSHENPNGGVL